MTPAQFELITRLLQSKEPAKSAARMVLIDGKTVNEAVQATGVLQPSVSRIVRRCRETYEEISQVF